YFKTPFDRMFRKILVQDSVCISSASENHLIDSKNVLSTKYIGKVLPECGICIKIINIEKIIETNILEDCYMVKLITVILVYQPIKDELIECTVKRQTENGLICDHPILGEILIDKFFQNTTKQKITITNSTESTIFWLWQYKNSKFLFKNHQNLRCKIYKINYNPFFINARVDEMGLGSPEWW
ncbi:DNA-directed RNA polymerase subunit E, partial [Pseudoloma neurophilia]